MRILYFDCFSGISGDMAVGALADLGVTPSVFEWELSNLEIGDSHLHFERQTSKGFTGVKFTAHGGATHHDHEEHADEEGSLLHEEQAPGHENHQHDGHAHEDDESHEQHEAESHSHLPDEPGHHPHEQVEAGRSFSDLSGLINKSELSAFVKKHALSIFRRIAQAEGKTEKISLEKVRFHDVEGHNSIIDVVLACIGIEALQVDEIHFLEPSQEADIHEDDLQAPVTIELSEGFPKTLKAVPLQLFTPAGAAIVTEFQFPSEPKPQPERSKIGYGFGGEDAAGETGVLRVFLADSADESTMSLIEGIREI